MRNNYLRLLGHTALVACALFMTASCGDDDPDEPDDPDKPDVPEHVDPDTPVDDPAGTVTVNLLNDGDDIHLGDQIYVGIDEGNNLFAGSDCELVSVGNVAGLGNIVEIPSDGWKRKAAVAPGEGYVIRNVYRGSYARLYVVGYMTSTAGGIMGAQVKYQCPFQVSINLSSKSVEFGADDGLEQSVDLLTPTAVSVLEKPAWLDIRVDNLSITFTAQPNYTASTRSGTVMLGNSYGEVTITATQKASSSPLFAGGMGTEESPYQISTAAQLDNVRKVPSAHYIQTADISLSSFIDSNGSGWEPINDFSGSYDGQMHKITGLWIDRPTTDNIGLFGAVSNATISRIKLTLGDRGITGQCNVGGITGNSSNDVIIRNVAVEGNISGNNYVAGILYGSYNTQCEQCSFIGNVTSSNSVSEVYGICSGSVTDSFVIGNVVALEPYGSVVKAFGTNSTNCYIIDDGTAGIYGTHCYGLQNKTDEELKKQSTYEGWDFVNVWQIREGVSYPTLRCFD